MAEGSRPFCLSPEKSHAFENVERLLPLIQKCFSTLENEKEVLRGIEVAFSFCLKCRFVNQLEEELLNRACTTTKSIFVSKLRFLENLKNNPDTPLMDTTTTHLQVLDVCFKILSYLNGMYDHVDKLPQVKVVQIGSLLTNSAEIIHDGFFHCKVSQDVYSGQNNSLTDCLTNLFEKCSKLLDQFSGFVVKKFCGELSSEEERSILQEVLTHVSRSGIILINLEVKTMVTAWKTFTHLIDKYFTYLKDEFNIENTIYCLSSYIISKVKIILQTNQGGPEVSKSVKLACFALKLVIKFCELFNGHLINCQNSLLNLLLALCQCSISPAVKIESEQSSNEDFINQLAVGADPLLSLLISDEELVMQCSITVADESIIKTKSAEFLLMCCLIFKKLTHANTATRKLWFNNENNLLQWLFECIAFGQPHFLSNSQVSNALVAGKQKKLTSLYENVLVTTTAFLATVTSPDFHIVEKVLIKNLIQTNLLKALLSIDIWCLLARFSDKNLCLEQIHKLIKIYHMMEDESFRVEKWYLKSLIFRLIPVLKESQKEVVIKEFHPFSKFRECGSEVDNFSRCEINDVIKYKQMNELFNCEGVFEDFHHELEESLRRDCELTEKLEKSIVNLWRFNCEALASCSQSVKYMKVVCALTAFFITQMSSDSLSQVLRKLKQLVVSQQQSCIKLYITWILNDLSRVKLTGFQQLVAEIFHHLLLSRDVVVKQKIFETFYFFSHITSHSDVITLSIRDSPILKTQMTSYFKKQPLSKSNYDLHKYIITLHQMKYEHTCNSFEQICADIEKPTKTNSVNVQDILNRWKEDGEKITKFVELLTKSQIKEIKELSNLMLSLVN